MKEISVRLNNLKYSASMLFVATGIVAIVLSGHNFVKAGIKDVAGITMSSLLYDAAGKRVGEVMLLQGPGGVMLELSVQGLPKGPHGLHIHQVGKCDGHGGFKSAAGHLGLTEGGHGLMNPQGPEAGDFPNIIVGSDDVHSVQMFTDLIALKGAKTDGYRAAPLATVMPDEASFIIHEGRDDHQSQPIGGSGARIACGIIKAS